MYVQFSMNKLSNILDTNALGNQAAPIYISISVIDITLNLNPTSSSTVTETNLYSILAAFWVQANYTLAPSKWFSNKLSMFQTTQFK